MVMKIKCPLCESADCINSTSLFRHLMDGHTGHETSSYLAIKIFKIHETLEKLETNPVIGLSAFFTKDGVEWAGELRDAEIRIVKSLLENEK